MVFAVTASPMERFSNRYEIDAAGCWLWRGHISNAGYGSIWIDKKNHGAHRMAYILFRGDIPADALVCHRCDVKRCVNPDHLFLGDYADNAKDAVTKFGHWGKRKLSDEMIAEIIASPESSVKLAKRFPVTHGRIRQIRRAQRPQWLS